MKNLKEIAAELNLSPSTISRVVNNKSTISDETRQKVLGALKKYNYTPNLAARSLKLKTTGMIGVVVPDITERFFGRVIKAVSGAAEEAGYGVLLSDSGEDTGREIRCIEALLAKRIDGVILATVDTSGSTLSKLSESGTPTVLVDNALTCEGPKPIDTENGEITTGLEFDTVTTDNVLAGRMGTSELIAMGCRKIGMICGSMGETTGHDRLLGYRLALSDAGIEYDEKLVRIGDFKELSGYNAMKSLMDCDGVFASSSKMTFGALRALREAESEVKLVGFDISDGYESLIAGIPSVIQHEDEIGRTAFELLSDRIFGRTQTARLITTGVDIIRPH
nr:LacI family DNA-binding transcriptional regulator [Clostridia bacterium]